MTSAPAGSDALPAGGQRLQGTDLFWKGKPVTGGQAAAAYFLVSLVALSVGIGLNYALTDGAWQSTDSAVTSAFGQGPTYLTTSTYDVTALTILVLSLVLLGSGFLAGYEPTLRSPWLLAFVAVAVASGAYAASARLGWTGGDPVLWWTLAAIFGIATLTWFVASFVGRGTRMHLVRAAGFVAFGFYWATQAMRLYAAEEGDFVNAFFAALAVFFFNYFAYQELLSIQRREDPRSLHWLAGASFLTTGVYVATHKLQVVSEWLILKVAAQTTWLLQFFGENVERNGGNPSGSLITYPGVAQPFDIQIILACTAVQSIMIFVGGIFALRPPMRGEGVSGRAQVFARLRPTYQTRRLFALLLTVPLIYGLNLFRNVLIISWTGDGTPWWFNNSPGATAFFCNFTPDPTCGPADAAFWFSHNIVGKGGSLVALVLIAFMVFQILPELYDSLVGLLDLKERRGPLERWMRPRRGKGGASSQAPSGPDPVDAEPSPPT